MKDIDIDPLQKFDVEFWDARDCEKASRLTITVYKGTGQYEKYLSKYLSREETVTLYPAIDNYAGFTEWTTAEQVLIQPQLPETLRQWLTKAVIKLSK
jgi:hypothetical protein